MINISGSYTLGGKTNRNLASQVEQNKRDIQYLLDSGLLPEGELEITENGEYDVKTKASVSVEVPQGIFPTGTKIITSNGSYDVEAFKTALINVSGGVEPVGTKQITENGNYDVRLYANAEVNVHETLNVEYNTYCDVTVTIENSTNYEKPMPAISVREFSYNSVRNVYELSYITKTAGFIGANETETFTLHVGLCAVGDTIRISIGGTVNNTQNCSVAYTDGTHMYVRLDDSTAQFKIVL